MALPHLVEENRPRRTCLGPFLMRAAFVKKWRSLVTVVQVCGAAIFAMIRKA